MSIPTFPEANHPIIKSLFKNSDQELLELFQRYPDAGQYFTALFCRYSPIVYRVVQHSAPSPVQTDYLFALIWRHVFNELSGLDLQVFTQPGVTFQSWLLNVTAACINELTPPPVEEIHYDMQAASPPFWCYLDRALDAMSPDLRLMIVMAQTFNWSETRISAYLQAEGDIIPPLEVKQRLQEGYRLLEARLPEDIRVIYLGNNQPA
ncbi:sigma-70 family RNA polymerase sigma factor [Alkalinema sp. FACHB-956]|uniref:sigma-70 family RNA polymerase sigma factor n=1 Tax=Alkalinema sp. FACHB-956 TaxID=2692768 RepID=UPI0016889280|nr:sigma-70 family RNA polymerase sigma factor [Alkalinema sp. FACHB-956]